MTWICTNSECNWTGDDEEVGDGWGGEFCPLCGSDAEPVDRDPDPLDDEAQTFRNVEVAALRGQMQ